MESKVYMPYFSISIGGQDLPNEIMNYIEEVTLEDNATGSDLLSITMTDPNFVFLEDSLIVETQEVVFVGGWEDDPSVKFTGYISAIDISFPESGSPTLVIHCMDETYNMNREKVKKTWKNMKKSDVAKAVFAKNGLKAVVDDTGTVEDTISQSDSTDIEFLMKLAKDTKEPYICYTENGVGYFVKRDAAKTPSKVLVYRDAPYNLISFSPKLTTESKTDKTSASDVNTKNGEVVKSTVDETTNRHDTAKSTTNFNKSGGYTLSDSGEWNKK